MQFPLLRSFGVSIALLWLALAPVSARADDFFATTVSQPANNDWTDETESEGNPGCGACDCNSTLLPYSFNDVNSSTEFLTATAFGGVGIGGRCVTVFANVMARYDIGEGADVRVEVFIAHPAGGGAPAWFGANEPVPSADGNCRYVFAGNGWDITSLMDLSNSTVAQQNVDGVQMRIRRQGGLSNNTLRVRAFRLRLNFDQPPSAPPAGLAPPTACEGEGGTLLLSAQPGAGNVIQWFAGSCGGQFLGESSGDLTITAPTAPGQYQYFARATRAGQACPGPCWPAVVFTRLPAPAAPGAGSGSSICPGGSANITASVGAGEVVDWYVGSCGGSFIGTGSSFPVSPSSTTAYFARARNASTGCVSLGCATVTVTVNPRPGTPTPGPNATICAGGSATLSASVGAGETVDWFTGSCGGSPVSNPVSPSTTTTYFGRARNTNTGCVSSGCATLTVTVNQRPGTPTAGPSPTICAGDTAFLSGSMGAGEVIDWSTGSCGGAAVTNPVSPAVTTTYFGRARNTSTGCVSSGCATVTVTVNPRPGTPTPGPNATICAGGSATLSASVGAGETVDWFTGACGGSPVSNPVSPSTTTTYFGRARNTNTGCVSSGCVTVTVTVDVPSIAPTAASASPSSYSATSPPPTVTLTAAGGSGTELRWYRDSCGGTYLGSGNGLVIPAPAQTTTYFVGWQRCGLSQCASCTVTVNPAVVNGACCAGDCTCLQTTQSACTGAWHANQACAAPPCEPCGSCCINVGQCTVRTQSACSGVWFATLPCNPLQCLPCNSPAGPQAPGNDICANGTPLVVGSPLVVSTICAGGQIMGCGVSPSDVWCTFQAPFTDNYQFTCFGVDGNGTLALASDCVQQTILACDASCRSNVPALVSKVLFPGESVKIRVANCNTSFNILTVRVDQTTPIGACCRSTTCDISASSQCVGPNTRFVGVNTACNLPSDITSPCCRVDFNQSGSVTVQDIFDFLAAYFGGSFGRTNNADFNRSESITVQDIFDFLAGYFPGCP